MDWSAVVARDVACTWAALRNGDVLANPALLYQITAVSFADLKKQHFLYWVAFPALKASNTSATRRTQPVLRDTPTLIHHAGAQ